MEALQYQSELNHAKNLEREFVNVHSKEENSYIAKSNSNRSIENSCNNSSKADSYKGDFREKKHKAFPGKGSEFGISGQNFESGFLGQNPGQNPGQNLFHNKTQTPPVLTFQDPDFNRVNVQLSPANQQYALNAATIASRSLLPKIQLEKFDGDVSMFRILRKSYQSIVESNLMNDSEESKLVYLLNHLKGEPHELVQSCMFLNRDK